MKIVAVALLSLSTGGCSLSYGIVGLQEDEPEVTGAIALRAVATLSPDLDEEDWRRAKAALGVALDPQGPGTQVSWDNPGSGAKGSFTPMGAPFVRDDDICRSFLARLATRSASALQGVACRPSGGEWVLKEIKPAKAPSKV